MNISRFNANSTRFNKMHFGLFDKKGNIFVDYLWSTSYADVYRHFHFLVNQQNTILNIYVKDFCVYLLGSIDDVTGEYDSIDKVLFLECVDFLAPLEHDVPSEEVTDEVSH